MSGGYEDVPFEEFKRVFEARLARFGDRTEGRGLRG